MNICITISVEQDFGRSPAGGFCTKAEKSITVEQEYSSGTLDHLEEEAAKAARAAVKRWTA